MRFLPTPMCRINRMSPCPAEFEEDTTGWTIRAHCTKAAADMLRSSIGQEKVHVVIMRGERHDQRHRGHAITTKVVYDDDPKYPDWPCIVTLSGSTPLTLLTKH